MLSSRLVDTTNKCNIIRTSMLDDLYPYVISTDGSSIQYNNNTSQTIVYNKLDAVGSLAVLTYPEINEVALDDCWLPIFIDNDNYIDNKILSDDGSYSNGNQDLASGRIGIEDFLSFSPSFKNFTSSGKMSVDWILNRHNIPYAPYYGILCWVRRNGLTNPMTLGGATASLETFANGTRLKHSSRSGDILIKIDQNTLYVVNAQRYSINTSISHNNENGFIIMASTLTDSYSLADTVSRETWSSTSTTTSIESVSGFSITGLTNNVKLWIPDGDCIFYHSSSAEEGIASPRGIPTNGFISPCLTRPYSYIYRILTLDQPRSLEKKDLIEARCYRKLAHSLSTSPFIGEFAVRSLDSDTVKTIVENYIASHRTSTNITTEKQLLKTALKDISVYLQKSITIGSATSNRSLYVDTKPSPYSLNNNIICNKNQLVNKLVFKYGASLLLSSASSTLAAKSSLLKDNSGIAITQGMDYYISKTTSNALIFNNQTIQYDNTTIKTIINTTESRLSIRSSFNDVENLSVPLYDVAKPEIDNRSTLFQPTLTTIGYIDSKWMSNKQTYNPSNDVPRYNKFAIKTRSLLSTVAGIPGVTLTTDEKLVEDTRYPNFDAMNLVLNVRDQDSLLIHDKYIESQMSFYWEKISGPECEFIELNGGFVNTTRPSNVTANSRYIDLKIETSGRYVVQCTINSPYGTFKKQKTIYVYDGADLMVLETRQPGSNFPSISYVANTMLNKWYNENTKLWENVPEIIPNDPESIPIILNRDNLRVRCSKFNRVAISQIGGVFMPINTGFTVREFTGMMGSVPETEVTKLDDLYKFQTNIGYGSKTSATLSIVYGLESGTIAKISSIYIEKVRSRVAGCEQCFSLYEPNLRSFKSTVFTGSSRTNTVRYSRINKAPEAFALYKYEHVLPGTAKHIDLISFPYPIISTASSPPVKTYGGYNNNVINSLNINNNISTFYNSPIPGLPRPATNTLDGLSFIAAGAATLPVVSGFPLDTISDNSSTNHKLCYQRSIPYNGESISFAKGILHPNSGWIPYYSSDYTQHANTSSVLKFNPGARTTFSFVGPQIPNINTYSPDLINKKIQQNIVSSAIRLNIAQGVQWDPLCFCSGPNTTPRPDNESTLLYNDNQKHKEYIDTSTNRSSHGYRYLKAGEPKTFERTALTNVPTHNDEFGMDQENNEFTYSFAVTGPATLPNEVMSADGKINLRKPTVEKFGIKDIEVKLNFLNYVNTKNLVIWLEVDMDGKEKRSRAAADDGRFPSPIITTQRFLDQTIPVGMVSGLASAPEEEESSLKLYRGGVPRTVSLPNNIPNTKVVDYLQHLIAGENDLPGGPLSLILLNQEHVENNGYNFSIKFSDNAPKNNVLSDQNTIISTDSTTDTVFPRQSLSSIDQKQKIIRNHGHVRPSLAAHTYSDRESCQLSKILRTNRLNPAAATFSKFSTNTLFRSSPPDQGPCAERTPKQKDGDLNSATTFTLKIMILDEAEDMSPNDTLISNEHLTGLSSATKDQTSTDVFNSLCNWELILHTKNVSKFVPHTNPNLASYGNCDALSLLDHSEGLKYPGHSFIADLTNYKHLLPLANIDAPQTAISDTSVCLTNKNDPTGGGFVVRPVAFPTYAIVQIMASLIPATTGTLIGTATSPGAGYSSGFNAIISWFRESAFMSNLEDSGRQIFTQSYTKYPFGSPEKILLNVRKPDSLWYSLEATIMKYHNTPILQLKKHNYIKVERGVSKEATEFKFDIVSDYLDLLDTSNIPEVSFSCSSTLPVNPQTVSYPAVYNNTLINYGDLVNVFVTGCNPPTNINDGLYVALNSGWEKITNTNLNRISEALSIAQTNSILFYNKSLFDTSLQSLIAASRVIVCATRIPYDIFNFGDTVECYDNSDRLLPATDPKIKRVTIEKKGLIVKNNIEYSVFVVSAAMAGENRISPTSETNTLLVYSNNMTVDNRINKNYNAWSLDLNGSAKDTPPCPGFSLHSVGSYGNVSPFVDKNLLDKNIRYNTLQPTHSILNNQNNDQIKYNKISVYNNGSTSGISTFTNNMACGFSYGETDLYGKELRQTKTQNVFVRTESDRQTNQDGDALKELLMSQIDSTAGYNETNYSFMYLRTSSSSAGSVSDIPKSGYLTIENDFYEHIPIKFIDLSNVVSRLNTIDNQSIQTSLENLVGDSSQTTSLLASSNIKYISKHLDRLLVDPSSCHRPGRILADCPKLNAQTKLEQLYNERTDLLKLLEQQAVAFATVSYTGDTGNRQSVTGEIISENNKQITILSNNIQTTVMKSSIINTETEYGLARTYTRKDNLPASHVQKLSGGVLPKIEPVVTVNQNGSIDIRYNPVNLDHYWINIDPKQSCLLDFASNPKVLVSTLYNCIRANVALQNVSTVAANNNVCPDFSSRERVPQFPGEAFGDEGFTATPERKYKYTIPNDVVERNKQFFEGEYPAITGWTTYIKDRFFNINADRSLGIEGEGTEITVQSTETYLVPQIDTALSGNDRSGDILELSGIEACQTTFGSPRGFGLLGPFEQRVGKSTRVQNTFNLDNTNIIAVQVKRVPRLQRGCDLLGTIYRYGNRALFRQQSSSNPRIPLEIDGIGMNGPLNNSLYCWVCLEQGINKYPGSDVIDNRLKYASLPPFLQHQNEMMFRALFGSVDKIENRTDLMVSYYPWELIPYEYSAG